MSLPDIAALCSIRRTNSAAKLSWSAMPKFASTYIQCQGDKVQGPPTKHVRGISDDGWCDTRDNHVRRHCEINELDRCMKVVRNRRYGWVVDETAQGREPPGKGDQDHNGPPLPSGEQCVRYLHRGRCVHGVRL